MNTLLRKCGALTLLTFATLFVVSCEPEDTDIDDADGLALADGYYLAKVDADPVAEAVLVAENVEADGFASQAREGYLSSYIYLTAGNYNLVNVIDREIKTTLGSSSQETITDAGSGCDFNDYELVSEVVADGAAFEVPANGLYKVIYDANRTEVVLYEIAQAGLIGDATAQGWGSDQVMNGTVTAEGGEWKIEDVVLRAGSYKIRFNCRWGISRLIEPAGGLGAANGYLAFTNFGGTLDNLATGNDGANFSMTAENEGTYDFTLTWSPEDGFAASQVRTGDAPPITFDPAEHPWGVRGTAGNGWDAGQEIRFDYKKDGTAHKWYGVILLGEGEFKVTDGTKWFGHGLVTDNTGGAFTGNDNFIVAANKAGFYYYTLVTEDEGVTYTATVQKASWGIIGDATPGDWATSTAMTEGATSFSVTANLTADKKIKFRANDSWDYNLGGDLSALVINGADITVTAGGSKTITLTTTTKGATWTATIQ